MLRATIMAAACLAAAACGGGGEGNNAAAPADNNAIAGANAATVKGKAGARASILDTVSGASELATFSNAVTAAGITETLSGAQPYTVFAPTEDAFRKLPPGTMNGLLDPEAKGRLTELLTNPILPGTVTAEDLTRAVERGKGKAQLATVGGALLSFARSGDAVVVTDSKGSQARLIQADRAASNGVIHSIDTVLMP